MWQHFKLQKSLDAEAVFLRAPGVMSSASLRNTTVADGHVQKAIRQLDRLDIALVGVGPADFHGPLEEGDNFFTANQLAEVRAGGAVGQLHQRFIDVDGKAVATPLDELVVGISLDQLRNAKRRICVAGGKSKHKALALLTSVTSTSSHLPVRAAANGLCLDFPPATQMRRLALRS